MNKIFTKTDEFLMEQFEIMCPDAYTHINSLNPIARKSAEAILWGFYTGFVTRNDFSENEIIEFEIAVGLDTCLKCIHHGEGEKECHLDPSDCEEFEEISK